MPEIVGREAELAELYAFVEELPRGPCALVMEGEAGIGKTTLWEAAIARAERNGMRILRCRPAESEARMAHLGWMDLFRGVGDADLDRLPEPQRAAVEVALLRSAPAGRTADPRAVSAGTLGVLRSLSERSPVLIAMDDQQWLDRESAFLVDTALGGWAMSRSASWRAAASSKVGRTRSTSGPHCGRSASVTRRSMPSRRARSDCCSSRASA